MHRFFYIFNQFNEIAKKQDTTKQIYKSQEKKKKTEKSIKNNNDKKSCRKQGSYNIYYNISLWKTEELNRTSD